MAHHRLKSKIINNLLNGKILPKHNFEDLQIAADAIFNHGLLAIEKVLSWFLYLQSIEITGWRNKEATKEIAKILADNGEDSPLLFYSLFCPSYKKGEGMHGFRTDDVGSTSKNGSGNLLKIYKKTKDLGFSCQKPLAIFFDLALEQPEKVINTESLLDLEKNIKNFQRIIPKEIEFKRLSELDESLFRVIGFPGIALDPLPIPQKTFERIVNRGYEFYKRFGWSKNQVVERSKVIATSEAMVGKFLKRNFPHAILVYTPTMLERAEVYSGMEYKTNPLLIIFPEKELMDVKSGPGRNLYYSNGVVVAS